MNGDEQLRAIERAYREGYAAFVRVAFTITREEQSARDAVHDGFVQAVRGRHAFRETGSLEGWIWRIVVNEARRRRAAEGRSVPIDPAKLPETAPKNGSDPDRLIRAIVAALPERQRLALFLRYYADLDYTAIASALGIAEGTVAATLHAARAAVRTQLTEVSR